MYDNIILNKKIKGVEMKFNAKRFIKDIGGVKVVAEALNKPRTAPYRMINTRYMTSWHFEKLKDVNPDVCIDDYFEDDHGKRKRKV